MGYCLLQLVLPTKPYSSTRMRQGDLTRFFRPSIPPDSMRFAMAVWISETRLKRSKRKCRSRCASTLPDGRCTTEPALVKPFSYTMPADGHTYSVEDRVALHREPLLQSGQCRSGRYHCGHCHVSALLDSTDLVATLVCPSIANCIPGGSAYMTTFDGVPTFREAFSNVSFLASVFADASLSVFFARRLT